MVIGTILKSADRQVAGLINTAEGILSALFSTGSKTWKFDLHARRRSALPDQELPHEVATQTLGEISAGR
jgi:hypothetical protein